MGGAQDWGCGEDSLERGPCHAVALSPCHLGCTYLYGDISGDDAVGERLCLLLGGRLTPVKVLKSLSRLSHQLPEGRVGLIRHNSEGQ